MQETISIQEVLAEIRSATDATAPFLLKVVKSTGRSRGAVRVMAKCLKGHPKGAESKGGTTQGKFLHKEHDTIPIIDIEDGNSLKTPLISHIIGYNTYKVIH